MNLTHSLLLVLNSAMDPSVNLIFFVGMIVVMYFFMLRPQMKRAKEQKEFSKSTNVGDVIVTTAGIHGKIVKEFEDGTIGVEIDRNTIVKMEKSSISMEMTMASRKNNSAA